MNLPFDMRLDAIAFVRWASEREGRYELEGGRVVQQMTGTTRAHNRIVSNFVAAIRARLDLDVWSVTACDFAVAISDDTVRYPDVLVEPVDPDGTALMTSQPVLLVEVLSPSSVGRDFAVKMPEYGSLASVAGYVVASQDSALCWLWQRAAGREAWPHTPDEIAGFEKTVSVTALGLDVPLAEIYRGIVAPTS